MKKAEPLTRGARNHNPLNIRIGNSWLGEVANPSESEFECFVSDLYGLRAGFIILRRYIRRYHKNTIRKIISTWAPTHENPTDMYINWVAHRTDIEPDLEIRYEDEETMIKLVAAMAYYESHIDIDTGVIRSAYHKA